MRLIPGLTQCPRLSSTVLNICMKMGVVKTFDPKMALQHQNFLGGEGGMPQPPPLSYTFLVANYPSSTATLSCPSLCHFAELCTVATGLLHCSTAHASTVLLVATLLLNTDQRLTKLYMVFLAPTQLR